MAGRQYIVQKRREASQCFDNGACFTRWTTLHGEGYHLLSVDSIQLPADLARRARNGGDTKLFWIFEA
ncbi:hypothetical protein GCM10008020_13600 [Massilia psychrophila]|nr:hypothetical protein GCM10008020_13600 [Massilia psychrophila]